MKTKTLREIRVESGKSKRQYAAMMEIPYTSYVRYEKNLSKAPFDIVVKICKKLKIDITNIAC